MHDGVLYKKWKSSDDTEHGLKLVVPESLKAAVLRPVHDDVYSAHLGVSKTCSKLYRKYFWHRMKEDVQNWIRKCSVCGAQKSPTSKPRAKLGDCRVGEVIDRVLTPTY